GGNFATIDDVVAIDPKNGWWYKSCKHCFHSLKETEIHTTILNMTHIQTLTLL
ncbi:hypothetical protein S83_063520, partial [Arachis hypogaea]